MASLKVKIPAITKHTRSKPAKRSKTQEALSKVENTEEKGRAKNTKKK